VAGEVKRNFPRQHLDKTLTQIKDALKGAKGPAKNSLQKAKKIIENAERLQEK